jgi:multidrug efflux pump subunit AcrA (membrane-fusion protein)
MKNKKYIIGFFCLSILVGSGLFIRTTMHSEKSEKLNSTTTSSVKFISSTITADGVVTAQNQAVLNFLTSGKLTYLPFKAGDKVYQGQTIASLDSYALRKQLQLASNAYQTAKNKADQTQENNQAGILEGQQRYSLDISNKSGYGVISESTVIYDAVVRIVDNDILAKNSAQINIDLANYAIQLSSLTTPISGVIIRQDVTVSGVNVTPTNLFIIADPDSMVFRANIPAQNIYYVSEGSFVNLAIDGITEKIKGSIIRIYPAKVILPSGQAVYQADIISDEIKKLAKLDESGTALISTNSENVALVPAWTVLSGKFIWVDNGGKPELRQVKAGKIHGNDIEIISGLNSYDHIITDPKYITALKYKFL